MRQITDIFKNWRADVFLLLGCLAMLLMFCEAETLGDLLMSKAAGIGVGLMAFVWFRYWDARGMMDELNEE